MRGAEVFVVQSLCRSPKGATVNKRGATDVYTLATHGIFAGDAIAQF